MGEATNERWALSDGMTRVEGGLKTLLIWEFIVIAKLLNSCVHSQSVALGTPIARNQPAWTPAIALRAEKECKGAGTSLLTSLSVVEKRVLL